MRRGKPIALAILGLLVLGWVVFELVFAPDRAARGPTSAERPPLGDEVEAARSPIRPFVRGRPRAEGRRDREHRKNRVIPPTVTGPSPPPPPPPIPVEQARAQFEAYMAELTQIRSSGRQLSNEEWTEYYRRGNEAIDPLVRGLDSAVPEQGLEVDAAHRRFRETIMAIQPGPGPGMPSSQSAPQ
jgi:hypothetical protein